MREGGGHVGFVVVVEMEKAFIFVASFWFLVIYTRACKLRGREVSVSDEFGQGKGEIFLQLSSIPPFCPSLVIPAAKEIASIHIRLLPRHLIWVFFLRKWQLLSQPQPPRGLVMHRRIPLFQNLGRD
ncbi:hypothetical protein MRB53_028975 [Persea americana]|uniref:Uncharacterized protein n=1 Tax=Persea americana TaxID=3435 RepID=A0ACC2KH87_PERAE|nr:hypothetical protein MRB53_028975 [Persea americana]